MSKRPLRALVIAAVFAIAIAAVAQQTSIRLPVDHSMAQLKSGAGEDVVRKDCGLCHSTDYIVIQPHLTAKQWAAEVQKMIAVYGAPISSSDAKMISDYLAADYSSDSASSTKSEPASKNDSGKP
jgi:mono/diheme cytochrome c family protein